MKMEKKVLAGCIAALVAALVALGVMRGLPRTLLLCGCLISAGGVTAFVYFTWINNMKKGVICAVALELIGIGVSMLALL